MVFSVDTLVATGGSGGGADVIRPFAGGVLLADAVYQRPDGLADKADASSVATSEGFLGFVRALNVPTPGLATIRSVGDAAVFSGLTVGDTYILSTSPGIAVRLADTGNPNYPSSGEVLREVGVAAAANTMSVVNRDFDLVA